MEESKNEPVVQLTEAAVAHIAATMERQGLGGQALRIGLEKGGCSGYEYLLEFATEARDDDYVYEVGQLRVFIDRACSEKLAGAVLDYTDGLVGAGLKFRNPKATSTCGCGTSFSTN